MREASAVAFPFRGFADLGAHQPRQGQVLEKHLHELFFAQREDEIVLAFTAVAGLAASGAAAALRPLDAVAAQVVLVARVHGFALPALAMVEHRFANVLLGNGDVLGLLDVADVAPGHGALDGFADLLLVAAKEALAVAHRLVLARQTPINDLQSHCDPPLNAGGSSLPLSQELLRTRRYHSHSRRTCLEV